MLLGDQLLDSGCAELRVERAKCRTLDVFIFKVPKGNGSNLESNLADRTPRAAKLKQETVRLPTKMLCRNGWFRKVPIASHLQPVLAVT